MKIATAGLMCYLVALLSFINLPLHGQEASRLPKGAKLEAVLYKNADMVGLGYRYKEQFVENQKVEFFKLQKASEYKIEKKKGKYYVAGRDKMMPVTSLEPLLQGNYFTANGMAYVKGEWHPEEKIIHKIIYKEKARESVPVTRPTHYGLRIAHHCPNEQRRSPRRYV